MARKISVEIVGDASSLEKAFRKSSKSAKTFEGDISRTGKKTKGAFGGLAKVAGIATGAIGVAGLAGAARAAFTEMQDAQKVTAQTNAVLKSTGGVAKVSAKQVDSLAESLMKKSGVDDEAIKSGENVLLTFTKVRNEAGKGNDVFNQATKATLDLSVALGKDMQSSAILVGKALNDPVKGMGALSRAGIQFTNEQKATIKQMVKTGDTMGAQKMILKELTTQFGGSAEAAGKTLPGKLAILRESLLNLGGTIAQKLSPEITKVVDKIVAWMNNTKNQKTVMDTFKAVLEVVTAAVKILKGAFDVLNSITGSTKNTVKLLIGVFAAWKIAALVSKIGTITTAIIGVGTEAGKSTAKVGKLRGAATKLTSTPYLIVFSMVAIGAAAVAAKIKQLQEMVHKAEGRTFEKGGGLEKKLVPEIAKRIEKMKAAGMNSKQILAALRKWLGGHLMADDLIAEGFRFKSDPKMRKRLQPPGPGRKPPPAGRDRGGVNVTGGLHLHGVQDVPKMERELQKRSRQRQQPRRGQGN